MSRPFVSVYSAQDPTQTVGTVAMPDVCLAPIRPDHVRYIHTQMRKNSRQSYAVSTNSGYQTSAESWGTGRAVARIPRVSGGGTHRAGQAAFGNMCRGGGMYAPTRTWRRWHRRINVTEKRHALASAIAASAVAALVEARGHRIGALVEVPTVVSNEAAEFNKTKQAVTLLNKLGCEEELKRVKDSKTIRAGQGKRRNRKYRLRLGPIFVHTGDRSAGFAYRNIPGVEVTHVDRLNLLRVAPGGSLGRLLIFTQSAFERLSQVWGQQTGGSEKKGYVLPRGIMSNTDLGRIINSNEIQSVLRPAKVGEQRSKKTFNPLKNRSKVDPAYETLKVKKTSKKN